MIKVVKFGGSSVANAEQFQKVKGILEAEDDRKFIVVSACGKENRDDYKVTDLLYLCHAHIKYGVSHQSLFDKVKEKYNSIKEKLHLSIDLNAEFATIESSMKKGVSEDYLVSRGEYLTAKCMAEYLGAAFLDAADVICFHYNGELDLEKTGEVLLSALEQLPENTRVVVPGFYGRLPNGVIRVMSRGGSDITGAILANIVDADVYENWTDVPGILVADPRIVDHPMSIRRISYAELREMSYMGANVLHDEAIFPVKEKNIPINIRNTNDPANSGTMIMADCSSYDAKEEPHCITGITGKQDYTSINIVKSHASSEVGFLRNVLEIFEEYEISVETVPSSIDSLGIVVESSAVERCLYDIVARLKEELHCDEVNVIQDLSLIAIVGRGMKRQLGMSGRIFAEFGRNDVNIRLISQGSDEINIMVGVENRDFARGIRCIYEKFLKNN